MSDTKSLYDVVAKALANWGNGEAQDAFEALMGRLRDAEATRLRDNEFLLGEARNAKQAAIDGAEAERQRLLAEVDAANERTMRADADNAALLGALLSSLEVPVTPELRTYVRGKFANEPHPGAALLEEVEGLRKRVKEVEDDLRRSVAMRLEQQTTRDAALEEAAKVAQSEFDHGDESDRVRDYFANVVTAIRALKKTGQGE